MKIFFDTNNRNGTNAFHVHVTVISCSQPRKSFEETKSTYKVKKLDGKISKVNDPIWVDENFLIRLSKCVEWKT